MLRRMAADAVPAPVAPSGQTLVGELFRLHRTRCGQPLEAACHLFTHALGWELRLDVAGSVQRSEVCRSQDTALDLSAEWKAGMLDTGWS